jgi:AcrR family transcriptional regulator
MKKESSRDKIVNTAIKLFYRQGYSNTGINQIIAEAGISKSALYQNFTSKEDLLMVYLDITGAETIRYLGQVAASHVTPGEKVIAIFDHLEDLVQQSDFYGCHFLNMVYELPKDAVRIRAHLKKQKDNVRGLFAEILAPLQNEELADEIYILFEGALIADKVHDSPWPIASAKNIVKKLL